jgi:preprotein translocase subunit SecG
MIELGAVAFGLVWENWSKGVKKFLVPSLSRFTGTILTVWFIISYFLAV